VGEDQTTEDLAMRRLLSSLKQFDQRRPSLPGEHLMTLGAGTALLRAAGRRRSRLGKAITLAAGAALLWRALSGRDGVRRLMR
jgi:uncharacterized membrane protein